MMKITIKIFLLLAAMPTILSAQSIKKHIHKNTVAVLSKLEKGDKVPELTLDNILHASLRSASFSKLTKGKLVIIDFFATWCGPCIKSMPLLDSLQRAFKNEIIILPVSYEAPEIIEAFLKKNPAIGALHLPFIANDKQLKKMFPYTGIPHDVVIDKSGNYLIATSPENFTIASIKNLLRGDTTNIEEKIDDILFDRNKPLLVNGNGGSDSSFIYRSQLTHSNLGVQGVTSLGINNSGNYYRILVMNQPIIGLYSTAIFWKSTQGVPNYRRTIFNIPDSSKYIDVSKGPHTKNWKREHNYCYELITPKPYPDSIFFSYMLEDLNRLFEIRATKEVRLMDCWALVQIQNGHHLILADTTSRPIGPIEGKIQNCNLSVVVSYLNGCTNMEHVFDETNFTLPVNMELPFASQFALGDYPDIKVVRACLNNYGLDLRKVKRNIEVIVIDKN